MESVKGEFYEIHPKIGVLPAVVVTINGSKVAVVRPEWKFNDGETVQAVKEVREHFPGYSLIFVTEEESITIFPPESANNQKPQS